MDIERNSKFQKFESSESGFSIFLIVGGDFVGSPPPLPNEPQVDLMAPPKVKI